ncbi:MAG TPA: hypothetical protein ENK18_20425 [Deltaproteobacteria bacterium]|nr:hypothetical protein [Deltaproteobacteria bacterium]
MIEGPTILLIIAVLVVLAIAIAAVVFIAAVGLLWRRFRGSGPDPQAREDTLLSLGYAPAGPNRWSRPIKNTALIFEELDGGWRWSVQLPRYNTLTLAVEERSGGKSLPNSFATEVPAIDERFLVSSHLAAQALALVTAAKVNNAMLAMPYLSMSLRADELVLDDPQLRSMRALLGGEPQVGTSSESLEAEIEAHQAAATLVTAILGTLYSRLTGTLLPEHR